MRKVDAYGRVTADFDEIFNVLYNGGKLSDILVEEGDQLNGFNALCAKFNQSEFVLKSPVPLNHTPEEEHARRSSEWFIPEGLQSVDVRDFLLSLCSDEIQRSRVNDEMDLYEEKELIPLLKCMIYLVDHFRSNKVVWGVGRGSSVSSYVLYLIGIHKIDSLKYNLSIHDFLR